MLKFANMAPVQRLLVVNPDFRDFLGRRYPGLRYRSFLFAFLEGGDEIPWLLAQAQDYVRDLGVQPQERDVVSFALDTLVAFHIGRISAWYRANEISTDAEGYLISSEEYDEYLQLAVSFSEIDAWARDVYGMKMS